MVKKVLRINKIILITLVITMIVGAFTNVSLAKQIVDTGQYEVNDLGDNSKTLGIVGTIINAIQIVGIIVTLISVGLLGIKYMTGSVEQKAEYKKTIIPFIVGVGLITVTATVVKIIYETTSKNIT